MSRKPNYINQLPEKAIPLMPKLKNLEILEECADVKRYRQDHTLIFQSQTVEFLSLDFGYTSSIEMPNLQSYSGALSTLHQPTVSAQPAKLEQIWLVFSDIQLDDDRAGRRFGFDFDFSKMKNLAELDLGVMVLSVNTLASLPRTITTLGLHMYSINQQSLIEFILRN
uniref:Uncharacterized protein n=1 Tax=Anopheles albimanus TaxID=7167 RepID=A0A182FKP7_ANOAL